MLKLWSKKCALYVTVSPFPSNPFQNNLCLSLAETAFRGGISSGRFSAQRQAWGSISGVFLSRLMRQTSLTVSCLAHFAVTDAKHAPFTLCTSGLGFAAAIPKNRKFKKIRNSVFFRQRLALSTSLWYIEWPTFCQNSSTCNYFLRKKLNFHFLNSPIFGCCPLLLLQIWVIRMSEVQTRQKQPKLCVSRNKGAYQHRGCAAVHFRRVSFFKRPGGGVGFNNDQNNDNGDNHMSVLYLVCSQFQPSSPKI